MRHLLLIADAHPNMREGVRGLLADLFETVLMVADAASLREAVAIARADLLVVDFSLPISGSGNILRSIRFAETSPLTHVIVLSIHDEQEAVREAMAAGAKGYVLKRSAATELLPAVNEVFAGRTYVSPGVHPDRDYARNAAD
jgi:DNA-binding NarL/FixJ family response regulator